MSKSRPKSHKADGTPKRRWTAAERAAKGRKPRKSADKPRSGKRRDDRLKESQDSHSRRVRQRDSRHKERLEESSNFSSLRGPKRDARYDGSARRRTDDAPKGKRAKGPRRWEESRGERFGPGERRQRERSPQKQRFADKGNHGSGRQHDGYRTRSHSSARGEHSHLRGSRQHPERQPQQPDVMAWEPTADMPSKGVVAEGPSFASFDLPQPLVSELNRMGIKTAFPIQAATIADALAGRDILGRARTGSGKTLGFGLPLLASLAASGRGSRLPRAVILAPTRELAMQVANVLVPLAKSLGLRVTLVAGGMAYGPQLRAFERGVDVVVATPGRLIDLMDQAAADLSRVQITVLDEADHMAELGFAKEVQTILDATPADGQRMLFSATLDQTVNALVDKYLTNPITHEVDSNKAAVTTMSHHLIQVAPHDKNATVASIANRKGRTLLFVRTQHGADRVAEQLREAGVMAAALHGGLTQGARARVLAAFRAERLSVLVATDVAARGIHVDDVTLVLQVDPPMNHKDYLHRAGRTARAGEAGKVLTITLPHQRKRMRRLTGQAGVKAAQLATSPAAKELAELAGAEAPSGIAVSGDEYLALVAPPQARPRKYRPARSGQGSRRRRRK